MALVVIPRRQVAFGGALPFVEGQPLDAVTPQAAAATPSTSQPDKATKWKAVLTLAVGGVAAVFLGSAGQDPRGRHQCWFGRIRGRGRNGEGGPGASSWSINSAVAMAGAGLLGLRLIAAITNPAWPHSTIDVLLTGLVIGGGTKPLHDLIESLQATKKKAEQPASGK